MSITYTEKRYLACAGAVDQAADEPVDGRLLVGQIVIASWHEQHSNVGGIDVTVSPALDDGVRAWLITETWCHAPGYSAEGVDERVVSFEHGASLLLEHGAFEHLFSGA